MITKTALHPRNKHRHGYNFANLIKSSPALSAFIIKNQFNQQETIDFSNSAAVKALNSALLKAHYNINHWDFPEGYLCPPIPGRVDYIHYLADLLKNSHTQIPCTVMPTTNIPSNAPSKVSVLDIGTGASCIYPILGASEYGWHFVASDIDPVSIKTANIIISSNKNIAKNIHCRLQKNTTNIFQDIIKTGEFYQLTLCNPPFHKSLSDASAGSARKWRNLNKSASNISKNSLNFGGQKAELWCQGGELAFIRQMIKESKLFQKQVLWFTCLVSNKDHVSKLKLSLKKANVSQIKVIKMAQGQKISRFIAWSFSTAAL